jgi:S-DNA-T family DNA segregation ATPase FtsK/SpoIIIE
MSKNTSEKHSTGNHSNNAGATDKVQKPDWTDSSVSVLVRFNRYMWEVGGIFLMVIGLLTFSVLAGLTKGAWLSSWSAFIENWLGWGSVLVAIAFTASGILLFYKNRRNYPQNLWGRIIAFELAAFCGLALLTIAGGSSLQSAEEGIYGGLVGWGLSEFLRIILSYVFPVSIVIPVQFMILLIVFMFCAIIFLGQYRRLAHWAKLKLGLLPIEQWEREAVPSVSVAPVKSEEEIKPQAGIKKKRRTYIPPEYRKHFKVDEVDKVSAEPPPRDTRLPPLELLIEEKSTRPNERHINQTAGLIEKTLSEFGIPVKVVGFQVGPTVTQFALEPGYVRKNEDEIDGEGQRIRVSQITALQRDLALALSAERLRIQAPVPGRSYIGIEVPNSKISVVRLRPILESDAFIKISSPMTLAMGRDVSGQPVVADLSRMPHLLIAGTTGSGKSVCIAAMTLCLVMNNTPEELRLIMIDPKMVELVPFNGLPHLYGKVETDLERISAVLRWIVVEMERRYKLLEELSARDIESYNRKAKRRKEHHPLPRIVVMIDELADLMTAAAEQTEATIVRLAQMARATGIHLVVATQRPSTDVVTGLIKANFPARLSFAVASGVDSRVILDGSGAESLLGRGDMLYQAPEAGSPVRSQGVWVIDQEIEKVISFWQKTWTPDDSGPTPWDLMLSQESVLADRDELIENAIQLIKDTGKASASHLQRRLRIGYPRAARLIDELEDLGIVGPSRGGGREREILIEHDD